LKIGCVPFALNEEINTQTIDFDTGFLILPWLWKFCYFRIIIELQAISVKVLLVPWLKFYALNVNI
jgi:hypothetical protein